jgi:hypothetical protein
MKNNCKIVLYQKLVSNQYAIYVIFTIIQILIGIDEEYYKEKIISNNNDSLINIKNKENHLEKDGIDDDSSMSDSDNDMDDIDGIEIDEDIDNKEKKNHIEEQKNEEKNKSKINKDNKISFEEFNDFKKGILLYIEKNTQNKDKKKLINLMKLNKIENNFLTFPKKEKEK